MEQGAWGGGRALGLGLRHQGQQQRRDAGVRPQAAGEDALDLRARCRQAAGGAVRQLCDSCVTAVWQLGGGWQPWMGCGVSQLKLRGGWQLRAAAASAAAAAVGNPLPLLLLLLLLLHLIHSPTVTATTGVPLSENCTFDYGRSYLIKAITLGRAQMPPLPCARATVVGKTI